MRRWLEAHEEAIAERWYAQVKIREDRRPDAGDGLLESFLEHLAGLLPGTMGDRREEGEEVWQAATHLYGSLSLRRGLASGEVVEEIQLLREVVLRLLLQEPPIPGFGDPGFSRELLILNRILDLGVVQASVAYLDDLFFAHLQESGIPEPLTPELEEEIRRQLSLFRREMDALRGNPGGAP